MSWWSRLFGRRGAPAPPSRALPVAAEPEPAAAPDSAPKAAAEPEPAAEPADDREISPARLDQALQRLREEIPARDEGPQV